MSRRAAGGPAYFQDVVARFTGLELFFDLVFAFCLSFGCCAYLLAMNAMTVVLRVPKPESLSNHRAVLVGVLLILLALGTSWPPVAFIGATAAVLILHAGVAQFRSRTDQRNAARLWRLVLELELDSDRAVQRHDQRRVAR